MSDILTSALGTASEQAPANTGDVQATATPQTGNTTEAPKTENQAPTETPTDSAAALILGKFKSQDELAKAYQGLEKELGSRVKIPGEDATPEDWAKFYAKVGRPESPEGYELPIPEDNPQEAEFNKSLSAKAHELGLTKAQVKGLLEWGNKVGNDYQQNLAAQAEANRKNTEQELTKKWGPNTKANTGLAARTALNLLGQDKFQEIMNNNGLGDNPAIIDMFYRIGIQISEDSIPDRTSSSVMTKEEAASERMRIMNDKSHPLYSAYRDRTHKDFDTANKKIEELTRLMMGKN